jgi:hypothetical protein
VARALGQLTAVGCILVVLVLVGRWVVHRHDGTSPEAAPTAAASRGNAPTTAPTVVPTAAPTPPPSPTLPLAPTATAAVPVSTVRSVSRQVYTGEQRSVPEGATAVIKGIDLKRGDIVIGHAKGFMQTQGGCQVFLIRGPFDDEIAITAGTWTTYTGQQIPPATAEDMLQQEIAAVRGTPGCAEPSVTRLP